MEILHNKNFEDEKIFKDYIFDIVLNIPFYDISLTIENERKIAIEDLLEKNFFKVEKFSRGPYLLALSLREQRLVFDIQDHALVPCFTVMLSLSSFRKLIKDYLIVCESYYEAIPKTPLHRLETLDMARRSLHNEASVLLQQRLQGKIEIDFDTARRLFTLICILKI